MQHAVSQMIDKKAKMLGELEFYKQKIELLEEIIKSLDISIQVFDPNFDVKTIKAIKYRVQHSHFKGNEAIRMIFDVLREANDYLSTHEVTIAIMQRKNLDHENQKLKTHVQQVLLNNLNKQAKKGLIDKKGDGSTTKFLQWKIV